MPALARSRGMGVFLGKEGGDCLGISWAFRGVGTNEQEIRVERRSLRSESRAFSQANPTLGPLRRGGELLFVGVGGDGHPFELFAGNEAGLEPHVAAFEDPAGGSV